MRTYLRIINPIVAAIVFVLCLYAAVKDSGTFKPHAVIEGGFATYFLAKGLFCSFALFILGRILLVLMAMFDEKK